MESGVNARDIRLLDSGGSVKDKQDEYSSPLERPKLEEGDDGDHTEINKKNELEEGKLFGDKESLLKTIIESCIAVG
jgi:hypothetical protein